jgi:hypothetical protein
MRFHLFIITSNDEENFPEENLISNFLAMFHFGTISFWSKTNTFVEYN